MQGMQRVSESRFINCIFIRNKLLINDKTKNIDLIETSSKKNEIENPIIKKLKNLLYFDETRQLQLIWISDISLT